MIVFPWRTSEQRLGIRITTTYHVITSISTIPPGSQKQDINSASQKNYYLSREHGEKNEWMGSQTAVSID
jgi:hypothetical protein